MNETFYTMKRTRFSLWTTAVFSRIIEWVLLFNDKGFRRQERLNAKRK